jgi:hypothetical protein
MQDKKNQHILFTKENSPKNRSLLSNLLKKYPFSLNIRYKHLELNTLHSKEFNPIELRKLSTYAIDKQFLKMRFKKLNKNKDSYWLNPEADQAEVNQSNVPEESIAQDAVIVPPIGIIESEINQIQPHDVQLKTNEQELNMSSKNNKDEPIEDSQEARFTDWLEGLKKSRKSEDREDKSSEEKKKKKKKKKKKAKKDKAKLKHELEQAEIISETLAELMAKQGYTEKAIEMYTRLSLLFPEKNSYFASKIEDLNN